MLTTAVALLAVTVTTRSVFVTQVADRANASVVQGIGEFRTFAAEGGDPTTAQAFSSMDALLERYLARQTPESGEVMIGVAGTQAAEDPVQYLDHVALASEPSSPTTPTASRSSWTRRRTPASSSSKTVSYAGAAPPLPRRRIRTAPAP